MTAGALLRLGALACALMLAACAHVPDTSLHPAPEAVTYAALQHPFEDARLTVDPDTEATRWAADHPNARWLRPITTAPQARWLNSFQDLDTLPGYLRATRSQHTLPVLVAYAIPNRGCSNFTEGLPYGDYDRARPRPDSYHAFATRLVQELGDTKAVVVMEPDAVPGDCFDAARATTIKGAVTQLTEAGQHVYIDAGHPDWLKSGPTAQRLLQSGVERAEGVSLNVSNRYPTQAVADFGEELSALIGGRDYLVDTSRNGAPATMANLANDWCNRPNQGLGEQRTGSPDPQRYPHLAAELWIKHPGESDGNSRIFPTVNCHGETAAPGLFSPKQARALIVNAPGLPAATRDAAGVAPLTR